MAPSTSRFVLLERRTLSISIVFILALAITAPAVAEYLGPDRVTLVEQEVRDPENDLWFCLKADAPAENPSPCFLHHIDNPCPDEGGSHPSTGQQEFHCKWIADSCGCDPASKLELVEVTLPEATTSAELRNCSLIDGWCTTSPTLHLTAQEPLDGQFITVIEGTRNGVEFACAGDTCDVPLLQGQNEFTFWAHSTWDDTSQMGAFSAKVDSEGPSIGIPDAWTIWEPLAIQVDDPRGVELIELTVKGGEYGNRYYQWNLANLPNNWIWDRYFDEIVAPIGEYSVTVEAWDLLGNGSTAHGTIVIPPPEPVEGEAAAAETEPETSSGSTEPAEELAGAEGAVTQPTPTPAPLAALAVQPEAPAAAQSDPISSAPQETTLGQPLWGAAATALSYVAANFVLSRRKDRAEAAERLRREVAKSASKSSMKQRMARLYERYKPRRAVPAPDPAAGSQAVDLSDAAAAATAARWQAIADFYEEKAKRDAARASATAARERAHAARRQDLARYWAAQVPAKLDKRSNAKDSPKQTSQARGTPVPGPDPVPVATPEPSLTSTRTPLTEYQRYLALSAKYGFCVYPLTDPDANENRIITSQLTFGRVPITLEPDLPDNPLMGLTSHPVVLIARFADFFNTVFGPHANVKYLESLEPNVDLSLHYATYDDGVRVPGIKVENNSDVPVVVANPSIELWRVISDEISYPEQSLDIGLEVVAAPGELAYVEFDPTTVHIPDGYRGIVRVVAVGVSSNPMWETTGWVVFSNGGAAELVFDFRELP